MNISYNWLKHYIDFDLSPAQTAEALTAIGLETDSVEEGIKLSKGFCFDIIRVMEAEE